LAAIDVDDLETELDQVIPAAKRESASTACADAWAYAVGFLFGSTGIPTDNPGITAEGITALRKTAKRIAVRFFTNPQDRGSYSGPDGLSYTAAASVSARILTQDEKDALVRILPPLGFA
jgi:hypothetical protein